MKEPPDVPDGLTCEEEQAFLRREGLAINLRDKSAAAYLAGSASPLFTDLIDLEVWETYVLHLREDAKLRGDPIEQMLIDQIVLAYHNIGRLQVKAADTTSVEHADVYNSASVRLLGEFRRLVLALREYRAPIVARQMTVVNQQNVSRGDQQIAVVRNESLHLSEEKVDAENELRRIGFEREKKFDDFTKSTTGGRWEGEPIETARAYRRGAPEASGGNSTPPTVAAFDGT